MTLVVGIVHQGEVWMGSDSACCDDNQRQIIATPKMCRKGEFLIGCAGTLRATHIVQYHLELPQQGQEQDVHEFICRDVAEAIRECFVKHDCIESDKGATKLDANILIGYRGRLFAVHTSWQVVEDATPYHSIGSAYPNANGALYALERAAPELPPLLRLELVLETASAQVMDVAPPFHIEKL